MGIIDIIKMMLTQYRVKKNFMKKLGYPLNLQNPKTYCEKIQWLKFNRYGNDKNVIIRADKYAVRGYIESKGFGKYLVPLYGNWAKPEEIDWQKLPNRFVLKLNNGSGPKYCWFVKDNLAFSKKKFEIETKAIMLKKYGEKEGEFHYGKMLPMILAEEYLEDDQQAIKDYKFYCFNGEVAFFSVEQGKIEGLPVRDYYDLDWNSGTVKFFADLPRPKQQFEKPDNFDQMLFMAKSLSQGYPHIRVDLYNIAGRIYFGELTFTPENGMTRWDPLSLDLKYGRLMNIHN